MTLAYENRMTKTQPIKIVTFEQFKSTVRSFYSKWYQEYEHGFDAYSTTSFTFTHSETKCGFSWSIEDSPNPWRVRVGPEFAQSNDVNKAFQSASRQAARKPAKFTGRIKGRMK